MQETVFAIEKKGEPTVPIRQPDEPIRLVFVGGIMLDRDSWKRSGLPRSGTLSGLSGITNGDEETSVEKSESKQRCFVLGDAPVGEWVEVIRMVERKMKTEYASLAFYEENLLYPDLWVPAKCS